MNSKPYDFLKGNDQEFNKAINDINDTYTDMFNIPQTEKLEYRYDKDTGLFDSINQMYDGMMQTDPAQLQYNIESEQKKKQQIQQNQNIQQAQNNVYYNYNPPQSAQSTCTIESNIFDDYPQNQYVVGVPVYIQPKQCVMQKDIEMQMKEPLLIQNYKYPKFDQKL